MADLTASPALCVRVRRDPRALDERYKLTSRERDRLVGIVRHPGMACACTVYRANRLAPLAMYVPRTCRALGPSLLREVVEAFWATFVETDVHMFIETDRFCRFLQTLIDEGHEYPPEVTEALAVESVAVEAALRDSYTERGPESGSPALVRDKEPTGTNRVGAFLM
jgi:hypothetical protein